MPDGSARDAAPAINAVVRKWPGCSHMNYKTRIEHAVIAGVLALVLDKWQNPRGRGRARTYRLHVPVPVPGTETLDHSAALAVLVEGAGVDEGVTDYLVAVLATAEPLAAHSVQTGSLSAPLVMVPSASGSV